MPRNGRDVSRPHAVLVLQCLDSWLLPNKWHRAVIGAAGMYVEIWLASIATFLWWYSEPVLAEPYLPQRDFHLLPSVPSCFNGNPLLRFDGYYILSDLAEIPNLATKGQQNPQYSCWPNGVSVWNCR